jgi:Asp-tRNA(Asn)/Glu-tRNA(Gln) amidotransferase B subunit
METIKQIENDILIARKENNAIKKNLLMTLKGEYQNNVKNGQPESNETLEKLIRKYIKNAELINNDESKLEIDILNNYLPKQLTESELKTIIEDILKNNPAQTEAYKLGNKSSIGIFMKEISKETSGKAEPKTINKLLISILNER